MSSLIPQAFIDELLTRTDIIEFIDSHLPLKKRGNNHLACCPFHNEKTPSFNVVGKKQFYHCFGCGASGNAISFAMNYLQQTFPQAIETLATRVGMQVPRSDSPEKTQQTKNLYHLLLEITQFYQQTLKTAGKDAIDYLKQRGVSGEIAKYYQIGYAPAGWQTLETMFKHRKTDLINTGMLIQKEDGKTYDRYRHRITFPIHDRNGRIIGFGGRALDTSQTPKYLNSPETAIFQKSRELYGLHQIIQSNKNIANILIVEGYMDVIALAQFGIMNAVATLGTATSTYHIHLLSKYTKQLLFCFDGDTAGKQAAWRALESSLPFLNDGLEANFIFLPDGHDPDSLVREEGSARFLQRINNAIPLNRLFFDTLMRDIKIETLAGKSQLVNAVKPFLFKMPDGPYKQLMINELARLTRIEDHRIQQLIADQSPEKPPETNKTIARTPLRIATALLLQHPEIYMQCREKIQIDDFKDSNQSTLRTLMQQIASNPSINTAQLVECWRDDPLFEVINKLAIWEHQVPENALAHEFTDIISFLTKQSREDKIKELIEKSRSHNLTDEDRIILQTMLKERHSAFDKKN